MTKNDEHQTGFWTRVEGVVAPRFCVGCRYRLSEGEQFVCTNCLQKTERTDFARHPTDNLMARMLWARTNVQRAATAFHYRPSSALSFAIQELKYNALCGTSTVTTYVESTTGIAAGGRTGLTSLTVAVLFLLALFFSPFFLIIPSAATTSALVLVGVLMMGSVTRIDLRDFTEALPCFITILMMPFTASIAEGIVLGMLSYVLVKVFCGRYREISVAMYILAVFFVLKYVAPLI